MKLWDLFSPDELQEEIDNGYVDVQTHPDLPLTILNYSKSAMYDSRWNHVTENCRGTIYEQGTHKIIARGPRKFYNYGQAETAEYPLDMQVRVTAKEDGSLGIGWYYDGQYGVATRGSFSSDQAKHATELINSDVYSHERDLLFEKVVDTRIFEIVYPENRIVLDYGGRDELIPLGLVSDPTGMIYSRDTYAYNEPMSLAEAIQLPISDDDEGYVLDVHDSDGTVIDHLKLKGDRYKQLHALLTNTTGRRIWVQMAARACAYFIDPEQPKQWAGMLRHDPEDFLRVDLESDLLAEMLDNVPDEFYDWVLDQRNSIQSDVDSRIEDAKMWAEKIKHLEGIERWKAINHHEMCKPILSYASGRGDDYIRMMAWQLAKPAGDETPFKAVDEGVA